MTYLQAFTETEKNSAKLFLATQVASMMGRKLEEGDWSSVYCRAKGIPDGGWSNLHIDVNYQGLGLELKCLRITGLRDKPIKTICGTTLMHPSATRSIRIDNTSRNATDVMHDVFKQYAELIKARTDRVRESAPDRTPDMRTGWLLWEDKLTEFLYFEERMLAPNPEQYFAEWNDTPAKGVRKASRSLWIYDEATKKKRYSVTTSAGIKIQPYFDVPTPSEPNLYYFRTQSEAISETSVRLWVSAATAQALRAKLGSLDSGTVNTAIFRAIEQASKVTQMSEEEDGLAIPIEISQEAHQLLIATWEAVSDEHHMQLLLKALA